MDYKHAGVDIEAGYKSVELMKEHIKKTMRPEVLTNIGGFSGAFSMERFKHMEKPTLVSGTDGVGTKLKLAFLMDKHDTIGIDCVAMCVNDIACAGGEPLFFLDYIACGKNTPEKIAEIVKGVATGCEQSSAALIGGETAEMPGFYPEDEYDLAGFAVGIVDEKDLITGKELVEGDILIGIASVTIKACSHITGGGFYENVPRMLPEGMHAYIEKNSYEVPAIFTMLAKEGNIEEQMMYNTYNMGIGMIVAVSKEDVNTVLDAVKEAGETPYVVGYIKAGEKGVTLC